MRNKENEQFSTKTIDKLDRVRGHKTSLKTIT